MYESFYELKEKPFTLLPDPEYLYLSAKHQRALTLLEYGMMNKAGFCVICGEMGVGKTTLIRHLLTKLDDSIVVGFVSDALQISCDVIDKVLLSFGLNGEDMKKTQKHQLLSEFISSQSLLKKQMVLIVDEAQNLSADEINELGTLSKLTSKQDQLLQIILVGQPVLREILRLPMLEKFAQRIAVDYSLEALNIEETSSYISHRLNVSGVTKSIFTNEACDAIYEFSKGVPRLINLLCDTSLVYGFAEQTDSISAQLVRDVVREQHNNGSVLSFDVKLADEIVPEVKKTIWQSAPDLEDPTVRYGGNVDESTDVQATDDEALKPEEDKKASEPKDDVDIALDLLAEEVEDAFDTVINDLDLHAQFDLDDDIFKAAGATERVFPIVHIEKDDKKGTNMLLVGAVAGMFATSIIVLGIAWFMFGSNPDLAKTSENDKRNLQHIESENQMHDVLLKEKNAALEAIQALKMERDAALKSAQVHKDLRAEDLRVAEELKRKSEAEAASAAGLAKEKEMADKKLQEARDKIKKAELAAKKARDREHKLKLEAKKKEAKLEQQRLIILQNETKKLEEQALQEDKRRLDHLLSEEQGRMLDEPVDGGSSVITDPEAIEKTLLDDSFSINPCDTPSAKFLSTCKK